MNEPTALIRDTAHWLTKELFDEVSMSDPAQLQPNFALWLTGFRYMMYSVVKPRTEHQLLKHARREATRYYAGHLHQKFHTWQDKSWFVFLLSRALLLACGKFTRLMSDDPRDLLRIEALHSGYYACLMTGITRMMFGMGQPDRKLAYNAPYCRLEDPFLPLN